MQQARFQDCERKVEKERGFKYRGTASIGLEVLCFRPDLRRDLDQNNVERLRRSFRTAGCNPLPLKNHIPAVINEDDLNTALITSGCSAQRLVDHTQSEYPELEFPPGYQLECLHGKHRVQAARGIFPPGQGRWIVDLYSSDISKELGIILREEYSNEMKPNDGEIYRNMQLHRREGNFHCSMRWRAWLSGKREQNIEQLFGHHKFKAAFDKLLDIPGLWPGMRITTLHKTFGSKIDEEALKYLKFIRDDWTDIVGKQGLGRVDPKTVKAVQMRAPGVFKEDRNALEYRIHNGEIFSHFANEEREKIWDKLCALDHLVPSLYTFFRDLEYLRTCADSVKLLLDLSPRNTIYTAMKDIYCDKDQIPGTYVTQDTESTYSLRIGRREDRLYLGYRQIWIFAMRNYHQMPRRRKKKNVLMKATCEVNEMTLRRFGILANRLGFQSDKISELIRRQLNKATTLNPEDDAQVLVSDSSPKSPRRCGFPYAHDHLKDEGRLFIDQLHHEDKGEVATFFVRKSIYSAFFGKPIPLGSKTHEKLRLWPSEAETPSLQELRTQTVGTGRGRIDEELEKERLVGRELEQCMDTMRGKIRGLENERRIREAKLANLERELDRYAELENEKRAQDETSKAPQQELVENERKKRVALEEEKTRLEQEMEEQAERYKYDIMVLEKKKAELEGNLDAQRQHIVDQDEKHEQDRIRWQTEETVLKEECEKLLQNTAIQDENYGEKIWWENKKEELEESLDELRRKEIKHAQDKIGWGKEKMKLEEELEKLQKDTAARDEKYGQEKAWWVNEKATLEEALMELQYECEQDREWSESQRTEQEKKLDELQQEIMNSAQDGIGWKKERTKLEEKIKNLQKDIAIRDEKYGREREYLVNEKTALEGIVGNLQQNTAMQNGKYEQDKSGWESKMTKLAEELEELRRNMAIKDEKYEQDRTGWEEKATLQEEAKQAVAKQVKNLKLTKEELERDKTVLQQKREKKKREYDRAILTLKGETWDLGQKVQCLEKEKLKLEQELKRLQRERNQQDEGYKLNGRKRKRLEEGPAREAQLNSGKHQNSSRSRVDISNDLPGTVDQEYQDIKGRARVAGLTPTAQPSHIPKAPNSNLVPSPPDEEMADAASPTIHDQARQRVPAVRFVERIGNKWVAAGSQNIGNIKKDKDDLARYIRNYRRGYILYASNGKVLPELSAEAICQMGDCTVYLIKKGGSMDSAWLLSEPSGTPTALPSVA
ncbi:hypothetical protein GP486_002246 [Trichoglossum hirsutum]|uniref:Uncharacterized protein n=1 Tax=Trichoglossum hirsutum TaxID=265104 RepID=A0A9P8LF55_9PEZI|nr:hypothetical protein GP486_002246 [Trichoglossum hirsutum]